MAQNIFAGVAGVYQTAIGFWVGVAGQWEAVLGGWWGDGGGVYRRGWTASAPTFVSMRIDPSSYDSPGGEDSQQFNLYVTYSDGIERFRGADSWSTSSGADDIDSAGFLTIHSASSGGTVTATFGVHTAFASYTHTAS